MSAPSCSPEEQCEGTTRRLGDLLYGDRSTTPVSEAEWVQLVRSIAAGDQGALHALYERSHRIVFTLMVRMTRDRQTAEELTADVFHDVWRRAAAYDPVGGTVVGWIMNQARSRAIDRLRFDNRVKRVPPPGGTLPVTDSGTDPQGAFDLKEQERRLREALTTLTPDERQAIEIAFFSGLTHHEVAARLNQPLGTVKTRIRAGLAKLRHALGTTGEP